MKPRLGTWTRQAPERAASVAADLPEALRLSRCQPELVVYIFERDWTAVDAARSLVRTCGLESRVRVHHASAINTRAAGFAR